MQTAYWLAFSSFLGISLMSAKAPDLKEQNSHTNESAGSFFKKQNTEEKIIIRSIVLVNEAKVLEKLDVSKISGIYVDSEVKLPGTLADFRKDIEPLYLNRELNSENLTALKNGIIKYYSQHHSQTVSVEIPEQKVTSGVVEFVVTQAKIGSVTFSGNKWFPKTRVEKELSLKSGDTYDQSKLLNDVAWLNQNPFHYSEVILSPGKNKGTSDLEIVTKDRFPLRAYAGGDNTGLESTGRSRYFAGLSWGDAFFADDLLAYQFTTNSTYDKFHSHSLTYNTFLPWQHILLIYGSYAIIHPQVTDFESHGKDGQASFRYKIPFKPLYTNFQHQIYFGFDYKYVTSALFYVGELDAFFQQESQVNVSQEMLGYQLEYFPAHHQLTFRLELFGSPAKWLPHQSSHAYHTMRKDADPRYFYATLALGDIYTFSTKDSISALLRVHAAANTLIPSEQFSLGGYNTVRGYEESVFVGDNGICANLELRARPISFFRKAKDELTFLAFIDYGWAYNYHAFDGITKTARLLGAGPGVRYNINPYFSVRADYGFKLHHVGFDDNDLGRWHVGASLSY